MIVDSVLCAMSLIAFNDFFANGLVKSKKGVFLDSLSSSSNLRSKLSGKSKWKL